MGNFVILTLIFTDHHLHTPMYFFLSNLSVLDIGYTSNIFPKLLDIFITGNDSISFSSCFVQLYFFMSLTCSEFLILAVMAYDRYVAICNPLSYSLIMNKRACTLLAAGSWVLGFLDPVTHIILMSIMSFCHSNEIDHFFCDLATLLNLSCSSTFLVELLSYILGSFLGVSSFLVILMSYTYIIFAILRIRSTEGRYKAFSTCSSHLTVVILFCGTVIGLYMHPSSMQSQEKSKLFSMLYVTLIPLFNPIIYSLKNKDVKNALTRAMCTNYNIVRR
ncbi:olfactory receptor 1019-like [Microcaecilia unicolor]|uniref:Olfactory receptor n=1 Tax=Microcaecilia unicolor TaxID=1415580 RepID=A0A6P7WU34_9AMPH|nr:olfactory receptor 1019-like [Microcaecilia unicolor]